MQSREQLDKPKMLAILHLDFGLSK